jgi:predicted transcriptional regulator
MSNHWKVNVTATETRSIFDTEPGEAAEAFAGAAADDEIEAGRFVPHDKVVEWLKSWGTPNGLPCPRPESH